MSVNQQKALVISGLAALSIALPLESSAANFSKLYVFGASGSDIGNIFNATTAVNNLPPESRPPGFPGPTPPSPPYSAGRFSNGPVYVEYLSQALGLNLTGSTSLSVTFPGSTEFSPITLDPDTGEPIVSPFFNGATANNNVVFSFGGAKSGETGTGSFGDLIPGVNKQVSFFVNDLGVQSADGQALYLVEASGNDFLEDPNNDPTVSVANMESAITLLHGKGARTFLIPNLIDLSLVPRVTSISPQSIIDYNQLLQNRIDELNQSLTNINIIPLDFYSLFNSIVADPGNFQLTDVTTACFDQVNITFCSNPSQSLFWDDVHLSTNGHQILSEFALNTLNQSIPESSAIWGLMSLGALGILRKSLTLRR